MGLSAGHSCRLYGRLPCEILFFLGIFAMWLGFFAGLIEGFEKFSLGKTPTAVAKNRPL